MIALLLVVLVVAVVAGVVGLGVALAVKSKQEFAEQNEVVPGRPSPAPASWAGAHSREAVLHRRLGDAVRGARANPRFVELGLAPQMAAVEAEALAIDERLVAAANLPVEHRDAAIEVLAPFVVQLEQTVADMAASIDVADSRAQLESAVSAADIKLRALAEARAEVERLDRQASDTSAPQPQPQPQTQPPPPMPGTTASGPNSS